MNILEIKDMLSGGIFSEDTVQKIENIIMDKQILSLEDEFEIKNILQSEIDNDFASMGIEDTSEITEINEALDNDLGQVQRELSADMDTIETELRELDTMRKEINHLEDLDQVNKIKEGLTR